MIMKRIITAAALSLVLAGGAIAQQAAPAPAETPRPEMSQATGAGDAMPDTAEACIAAAAALGQSTEGKTFSEDKLEKLDELFSKMETLCDGKQFAEAMAVAKDIKTVIDGQ